MPVCHYFLKGVCTNLTCPYSHVKVNPRAAICPDFLKGYCPRGTTCKLKHTNRKKSNSCSESDIVEEEGCSVNNIFDPSVELLNVDLNEDFVIKEECSVEFRNLKTNQPDWNSKKKIPKFQIKPNFKDNN